MKNTLFTLFAIGLAGLAAVAATTAFLNSPNRQASVQTDTLGIGPPAGENKPAEGAPAETPPATPPSTPPATPPTTAPSGTTAPATPEAGKPAGAEEPESDADPYEGIAPEDLPPDLQYDADSSVSFPTNI
jgi:hypothetical protein